MNQDPHIWSAIDMTEVVRHVVSQLAPEELEVVDEVANAWFADGSSNRRSKRAPGAAVGFGVEAVLLSQLLFPIVSGAIGDVIGTMALEPGRLKRKRQSADSALAEPGAAHAGRVAEAAPTVALTKKQAEDLHDACQRHARALGLPPTKAALLADAVLGSVTGL